MQPHKPPFIAQAPAIRRAASSRPGALWRWLTTPTFPDHTPETRAAARLLMVLMIVLGLLTLCLSLLMEPIARSLPNSQWHPIRDTAITLLLVCVSYCMARWGRPTLAIGFAITAGISGIVLISLPQVTGVASARAYLYLLIVPVTYASIFRSMRETILTALGAAVGAAVSYAIGTGQLSTEYVLFLSFLLITATVCIVGTHYRISLERSTHRELTESAARLRLITENIAETIIISNRDGLIEYVSAQGFQLLNIPSAEILGMNIYDPRFLRLRHPDDHLHVQTMMEQAMATLTPTVIEHRVQALNGQYVWLEMALHFLANSSGTIEHIIFVGRNIDDRKRAEFERVEKERVSADLDKELELSAVRDHLMQRLSHEFRTPLTLLQTSAEMLNHYGDRMTPEQRAERFAHISENVFQMNAMLTDIMHVVELQKQTELPMETLDLDVYGEAALVEWRVRAPGRVFMLRRFGDLQQMQIPTALLDPILGNLLENAVRYSPPGTPIILTLAREGGFLTVAVCDEGSTILPEDVAHLFEPFYRGREVQNIAGSGLGLYIAQACARRWGGRLGVEVEAGVGTTFKVRLPDVVN